MHFSLAKQDCITANKLRISKSKLPALPHNLLNGSDFSEIKITESSLPFLAVPVGKENPFIGGSAIKKFTLESVNETFFCNVKFILYTLCTHVYSFKNINENFPVTIILRILLNYY